MKKHQNLFNLRKIFVFISCLSVIGVSCRLGLDSTSNGGDISGKVIYSNTSDYSDIQVLLEKTDGLRALSVVEKVDLSAGTNLERSLVGMSTTKSDGTYTFKNLEEGLYTIYAESSISTKKSVIKNVVVKNNITTKVDDLILIATGSISGKITKDSSENFSYGYRVSIAGTGYQAITDIDGSFLIEKIPAGAHNLLIEREAFCYLLTDAVIVEANKVTDIGKKDFTSEEIYSNIKNGVDGVSIVWLGSFDSVDKITNPVYLNAYFNTTDGCSYIYDGSQWTLLASKGETGEKGDKGDKGEKGEAGLSGNDGASIIWLGNFNSSDEIEEPKLLSAYYNTTDGCSYIYTSNGWTLLASKGDKGEKGETGLSGNDGVGIVWRGSFGSEEAVEDPKYLNAYYNTTDGCSYIYTGDCWMLLASKGAQGETGKSLTWIGSFSSVEEIENPALMDAYYNTEDGCSYIYNGVEWQLLASKGATGKEGTSITWVGCYKTVSEIENPSLLSVYFNTTDGCSYIYTSTGWTLLASKGESGTSIVWIGSKTSVSEIQNPQLMNAYYNITDGCSYIYTTEGWALLAAKGAIGVTGQDGISITWIGSFSDSTLIQNPQLMNAYFNTTDGCSYIYTIEGWTLLAKAGAQGTQGICIVWRGSFSSASEINNPALMNAYYNTTDGCSYIYDGTSWTLLVKAGMNGISIVWKGELNMEPSDPEINWAYYDKRHGSSYIYDGNKWNLLSSGNAPGGIIQQPQGLSFELYSNTEENVKKLQISFKSNSAGNLQFKWFRKTNEGSVLVQADSEINSNEGEIHSSEYILPKSNYIEEVFYCVASYTYGEEVLNYISDEVLVTQTILMDGLPTIYINTENNQELINKDDKILSTVIINDANGVNVLKDENTTFSGRGNSTWAQEKKPYKIKLGKKAPVLGMPKHKQWMLIANYLDNSFLKNEAAFCISEQLEMDWTIHGKFVNLIKNNEYVGLYWIGEQIKVDENRIDIDEDNDYLIEMDVYYDEEWKFTSSRKNLPYQVKNDNSMTDERLLNLENKINAMEAILYEENFPYVDSTRTTYEQTYKNYIDISSMAKFYLINEIMFNGEVGWPKSCYFMFDNTQDVLKAGPVWDFDWAAYTTNTDLILKGAIYYDALFKTKDFNDEVNIISQKLSSENFVNRISALKIEMSDGVRLDGIRWGTGIRNPVGDIKNDWDEYVSYLIDCVSSRLNAIKINSFVTEYVLEE